MVEAREQSALRPRPGEELSQQRRLVPGHVVMHRGGAGPVRRRNADLRKEGDGVGADRLTANRFLRVNFFVPAVFPDPRFRLERVVDDLAARRPAYLIFEKLHSSSDAEMAKAVDALIQHPEIVRLLRAYRLETQIEDFTLYRRVD